MLVAVCFYLVKMVLFWNTNNKFLCYPSFNIVAKLIFILARMYINMLILKK